MDDDVARSLKVRILRDAAEILRRTGVAGIDPDGNDALAARMEQRAERIAAGGHDHSDISPSNLHDAG